VKVLRRRGRLLLRLDSAEIELLSLLLDELEAVLDGATDPDDDVLNRLYPSAYRDDDEADVEYRSLTESTLRAERHERIEACRADLHAAGDVELTDADDARRWIQVINDLRLALGTRIGIQDDDQDADLTESAAPPRVIYYWLTDLQDSVVHELMR
jgi:hypothetical protein